MGRFGRGHATAALAGLLLAGAAHAAETASADQLDAALSAQAACMLAAAHRLDDGISDAATVAPVVAAVCQKERDRWIKLAVRGESDAFRETVMAKEPDKAVQMATLMVLKARAAAREAAAGDKAERQP